MLHLAFLNSASPHRSHFTVLTVVGWMVLIAFASAPALQAAAVADLALTVTDSPDPVWSGDPLTYDITVTNNGPDTSPHVQLNSSTIYRGELASVTSNRGSCSVVSNHLRCELGALEKGATVKAVLVVFAGAPFDRTVIRLRFSVRDRDWVPDDFEDPVIDNNVSVVDTDLLLRDPEDACPQPTIPPPLSFHYRAHMWSMGVEVSADDGLVLHEVKLGTRLLARKMSLPYYRLYTTALPESRFELEPNGTRTSGRSRLVGFDKQVDADRLVIQAIYAVDRLPKGSRSCLLITQRYEFSRLIPGDRCEPLGELPCTRFDPIVKYDFQGRDGERLYFISLPQRFHFVVDDESNPNRVAVFQDLENPPPFTEVWGANPLPVEDRSLAVVKGAPGPWDNYHQTYKEQIVEPDFIPPRHPGCEECVHIHWRWYSLASEAPPVGGGPAFGFGRPLIPQGSTQSVEFGVVTARVAEDDPKDWEQLANGESLSEPVFWYAGENDFISPLVTSRDEFFIHGGFFEPSVTSLWSWTASTRRSSIRAVSPGLYLLWAFHTSIWTSGKTACSVRARRLTLFLNSQTSVARRFSTTLAC